MRKDCQSLLNILSSVIIGKEKQLKLVISCLIAKGHLLIEDVPGMGKTTLSHALAQVFSLQFGRIQFTSDLLPADILGVSIFNQEKSQFTFHKGPVFNQVVLADEINRASPKAQSALLEAMEEGQISIDGQTLPLPSPFFVIATQNPSYQSGTYPLPESQLDRFLMRISLGYPNWEDELAMLKMEVGSNKQNIQQVFTADDLYQMHKSAERVFASDEVLKFILRLVNYSRQNDDFPHPLSPRASKAILIAAKSWAFMHDRGYLIPEDVQAVFAAVAEHRLTGKSSKNLTENLFSQRLLEQVDPLAA